MKTKIMIVEDNFYKSVSTRYLLETKLRMKIKVLKASSQEEVVEVADQVQPDMCVVRPEGCVTELLAKFERRNTNRRNTEITMLVTSELGDVKYVSESKEEKPAKRKTSRSPRRFANAA